MALQESELLVAVAKLVKDQPWGVMVLVVGPMGSGKSTLLGKFTDQFKLRPAREEETRRMLQKSNRALFSCICRSHAATELADTEALLSRCGVSSVKSWLTVRQPCPDSGSHADAQPAPVFQIPLGRRADASADCSDAA